LTVKRCDILDEANLVSGSWEVLKEGLKREEFVAEARNRVRPVDGAEDKVLVAYLLQQHIFKLLDLELFLASHSDTLLDVFAVDADVRNSQRHRSTVALDLNVASFLVLVVQVEQPATCSIEMSGILKDMEADEVAADERLQDLISVGEHFVDV